jgi:hypothetical protein
MRTGVAGSQAGSARAYLYGVIGTVKVELHEACAEEALDPGGRIETRP